MFSLFLTSCTRERSNRGAAILPYQTKQNDVKPVEIPAEEDRTLKLKVENAKKEPEVQPSRPILLVQGREALLPEGLLEPVWPEDFKIGKLQGPPDMSIDESAVLSRVRMFFDGLINGTVLSEQILPDGREVTAHTVETALAAGNIPVEVRIGTVYIEEETGWANIRLFSNTGTAEGEVFLEKQGETWYIADMHIDLYDLSREYIPEGKFEPSMYRWLELY